MKTLLGTYLSSFIVRDSQESYNKVQFNLQNIMASTIKRLERRLRKQPDKSLALVAAPFTELCPESEGRKTLSSRQSSTRTNYGPLRPPPPCWIDLSWAYLYNVTRSPYIARRQQRWLCSMVLGRLRREGLCCEVLNTGASDGS
jgi:hypothetical protein